MVEVEVFSELLEAGGWEASEDEIREVLGVETLDAYTGTVRVSLELPVAADVDAP